MPSLNKVLMMGNLTRDPQLSYLPSQLSVCDFGLAVNRKFKKQDGSTGDDTCFVDCQIFGKRADVIQKYFKKGDAIFIEGRLHFSQWQDKEGNKKSKLRIQVENFEFVGGKKHEEGSSEPETQEPSSPPMFSEYNPAVDDGIPF